MGAAGTDGDRPQGRPLPRRVVSGAAAAGRATGASVRRVTNAGGAGESGLGRLLELHLISSAADALVVTALAATVFFAVPTEQARGQVATSLMVTMVPFVLLAPVIGPLLDRYRHGRRIALGVSMGSRAWLAWVMAGALGGGKTAFALYPAAFGFLVAQKAYLVVRAAAVPRVLPPGGQLVAINSRMSAAGIIALGLGGAVGSGLTHWVGPEWTLRLAFVVYLLALALTFTLTRKIDTDPELETVELPQTLDDAPVRRADTLPLPRGEWPLPTETLRGELADAVAKERRQRLARARARWRPVFPPGARSIVAMHGNAALRAFNGFLTLFLAFRLRTEPLPGLSPTTTVAVVIIAAAVGGGIGTALGATARGPRPDLVVIAAQTLLGVVTAWAAWAYGLPTVIAVALVTGLTQSLAKLCLDALIQSEVPDAVRTSAFSRSETVLQIAWVFGGVVGLVLPLGGRWGLGTAAALTLIGATLGVFRARATTQVRSAP